MYVAVKGGARAIEAAHRLLAEKRRGPKDVPELTLEQIEGQLALSVSRVMAEGSLYAPRLAALAVKQARGDLAEAVFLLRAARGAFPSFGASLPADTVNMRLSRRISATWKDLPGGQKLGPTFDYTHRLLDFGLDSSGEAAPQEPSAAEAPAAPAAAAAAPIEGPQPGPPAAPPPAPRLGKSAADILLAEGILELEEDDGSEPGDVTRETQSFPMERSRRLQTLARGDEGFVLSLAYSAQRGFGSTHPFVNELKVGKAKIEFIPPELGFPIVCGEIELTECETVNQFQGGPDGPMFTRGWGLVFGNNERKAMSVAIVERSLRAGEFGEIVRGPVQDQEFVLAHSDSVEASGFVGHLKLPHYVDFQSEITLLRDIRKSRRSRGREKASGPAPETAAAAGPSLKGGGPPEEALRG
jgi:alpha-D-ribose 1-methylphosphonate 5-triphosphate synthase subunit PhnI